jgi:hypothetical protein
MDNITLIKKSYVELKVDVTCVGTITKAYFMIKNSLDDADISALVSLTITGTLTASGQITPAVAPTATLHFYVGETALDLLSSGSNYQWCIKAIEAGHPYSPIEGRGTVTVLGAGVFAIS